jgi:antitoxin component HigA of HigAB toxin-antitoxin module
MQIQPIHTEDDYQKALNRIEEIFDAKSYPPDQLHLSGDCQRR